MSLVIFWHKLLSYFDHVQVLRNRMTHKSWTLLPQHCKELGAKMGQHWPKMTKNVKLILCRLAFMNLKIELLSVWNYAQAKSGLYYRNIPKSTVTQPLPTLNGKRWDSALLWQRKSVVAAFSGRFCSPSPRSLHSLVQAS